MRRPAVLLLRNCGKKDKVIAAAVYQAVRMSFGTVVAFAGAEGFPFAVIQRNAAAAQYVYDFTAVFVGMHAYRGAGLQPSVHDPVVLICVHAHRNGFFPSVKVAYGFSLYFIKVNYHNRFLLKINLTVLPNEINLF
jgi:hypothetical protein